MPDDDDTGHRLVYRRPSGVQMTERHTINWFVQSAKAHGHDPEFTRVAIPVADPPQLTDKLRCAHCGEEGAVTRPPPSGCWMGWVGVGDLFGSAECRR